MNKVMLIGNLTRDPELNTTNSGVSVCRFAIAVQRPFSKNSEGPQADFFNIVAWRGLAENCHKFYSTDIVASDVEFLVLKNSDGGSDMPRPTGTGSAELEPIDDDDSLPF